MSAEDRDRTGQYRDNAEREQLLTSAGDYDAYLESLAQKAVIRAFSPERLERITQLINKTNQYNLTTVRKTRSEVERLMQDDAAFTLYAELSDRFGDNGLISVLFGEWTTNNILRIDAWLMSCRVLKRGVEKLVCDRIVAIARNRGVKSIHGHYLPSARNSMVKNHYADLGFQKLWHHEDGSTGWELDVSNYTTHDAPIVIEEFR